MVIYSSQLDLGKEKEDMFYLMIYSTHFICGYMM